MLELSQKGVIREVDIVEQYTMFKDIAMIQPYYAAPERYTSSLVKEDRQKKSRPSRLLLSIQAIRVCHIFIDKITHTYNMKTIIM